MDTKRVQELEEKLAAIQREIDALKVPTVVEEIPIGSVVKVWNDGDDSNSEHKRFYAGLSNDPTHPFIAGLFCYWQHATPHPNYMMWRKHDGGPQPVGDDVRVVVRLRKANPIVAPAGNLNWEFDDADGDIIAFAVMTTPEFT